MEFLLGLYVSAVYIGKVQSMRSQNHTLELGNLSFMSAHVLLSLAKRKLSNLMPCLWLCLYVGAKLLNWFKRGDMMNTQLGEICRKGLIPLPVLF